VPDQPISVCGHCRSFSIKGAIAKFGRFEFGRRQGGGDLEADRLKLNKDYLKIVTVHRG